MRATNRRFRDALGVTQQRITVATCTLPDATVIPLRIRPGATVQATRGTGQQRTVQGLIVAPQPGRDLYALLATPLAVFHIEHGINFGAGVVETVPVFHGDAATGTVRIGAGDVTLALVDWWSRLEGASFREPFMPAAGTRASQIAATVLDVIPGVVTDIRADGGTSTVAGVWSGSRTAFITQLAKDGKLEVAFDAAGALVIREQPIIAPAAASWTFRTGPAGNIRRDSASRSKPFNKIYNTVVVIPANDSQAWARQQITLADPADPRHRDKIGVRAYEYKSSTLFTAVEANDAGAVVLQQLLRATEAAAVGAVSNPALEPGDTVALAHARTDTDPGFGAVHLLDSFTLDLSEGTMTTSSSDADPYLLETL